MFPSRLDRAMNAAGCFSDETLCAYHGGAIVPDLMDAVASHVHDCASCLDRLQALENADDPLLRALRGQRTPAGGSVDPLVDKAVSRVLEGVPSRPRFAKGGQGAFAEPEPGAVLGGYRILAELGRGGMGRVFRARHPRLDHEVALKVLRPGMEFASILARFEAERQALTLMDHPNIARVLDGGVTEDGRPFFVMELVHGLTVTRYCNEHGLSLTQRLELFISVCQAVQHAHQKGIIHRDLKPSNVVVAEYDGKPTPKVIDFGVAKAVTPPTPLLQGGDQRVSPPCEGGVGGGHDTEVGMLVGTPEYMSPEQADLTSRDIDTRSDVYALGVLLYELLTGDTPFGRQRLRGTPTLEVLRAIRDEEPASPSSRLSASETEADLQRRTGLLARPSGPGEPSHIARGTEPGLPAKLVRGELDWIVLKALDKDRTRRYETAAAFAEDVRRFLNDDPVLAGPPSRTYRFRKFVRRNRVAVLTGSLILVALSVGLVVVATLWKRSEFHRQEAIDKAQKLELQRRVALKNLRKAQEVISEFFNETGDNPILAGAGVLKFQRDLVASGLRHYQAFLAEYHDDPELRYEVAKTHNQLGWLHEKSGHQQEAVLHAQKSLALFQELFKVEPNVKNCVGMVNNHVRLTKLLLPSSPREASEHLQAAKRVLDVWNRENESDANITMQSAAVLNALLWTQTCQGQMEQSEQTALEAVRLLEPALERWPSANRLRHYWVFFNSHLARVTTDSSEYGRAKRYLDAADAGLTVWRQTEPDSHYLAYCSAALQSRQGEFYRKTNDHERAFQMFQSAMRWFDREQERGGITGDVQRAYGNACIEFSEVLVVRKQYDQAAVALDKARKTLEDIVQASPEQLDVRSTLAYAFGRTAILHRLQKQFDEAIRNHERSRAAFEETLRARPENDNVRVSLAGELHNHAVTLGVMNRIDEAVAGFRKALEIQKPVYERNQSHRMSKEFLTNHYLGLGNSLRKLLDLEPAIESYLAIRSLHPDQPSMLIHAFRELALCHERYGKSADQAAARERCAKLAVETLQMAIAKGYKNIKGLENDPWLVSLRPRADFQQVLTELKQAPK